MMTLMIQLDMVWPALYVSATFWQFWFLIIGTIVLETFTIKLFLKFPWTKSLYASLIGNAISGFIGTFVMTWLMLVWHFAADNFVPQATFDPINWVATYILMCLGSVFFEILTIKLIYHEKIKKLFLPMLFGNLLSYAFIGYVMVTKTDKDPDEVKSEIVKYLPSKQHLILLDGSLLKIDTASMTISYDKDNNRLNETKSSGYVFVIPFKKQVENSFQFTLRLPGNIYAGGIDDTFKDFQFKDFNDFYKVILEQKNPDTSLGWTKPIITDTLIFNRLNGRR
jgi:hypothetical protein